MSKTVKAVFKIKTPDIHGSEVQNARIGNFNNRYLVSFCSQLRELIRKSKEY